MAAWLWCLGADAAVAAGEDAAVTLYVAADGNDAWSGRLVQPNAARDDGPLVTLARARDELRRLKKEGKLPAGATVFVRAGVYCLPQMLKLTAEDSGTAAAPIVYRAYQNERPTLMGAKPLTGFVPHEGKVLKTDVAAQGFRDIYFRQLYFDGRRQHLARYPNFDPQNPYGGGWAYVDGKPVNMYQDIPGETKRSLIYKPEDERNWSRPEEGEVFIFARYNWWNNIVRIASLDRAKRQITLSGDASYAIRPMDRYYVRNLREELDSPGEWYLDRPTQTLYFWPPGELAGRPVYAPHLRTILELSGVEHVSFRGFGIENCEGTAVVLNNCAHCQISGNTIRNVGDYHGSGVSVSGGSAVRVVGNDIYETGSHGISLSGGDRVLLEPAGHTAENNYIHHVGVYYKQGVGVSLTGVRHRAAHNLIHDGPRMGIMFSGNKLLIEYNHIRHINLETEDSGAVYTGGRDWISSRGTVIRYNYFHDSLGFGQKDGRWVSPHFTWGVYLDDNAGGVDVIGNIVVRAFRAGLHLHNGRDNLIENNVFADARLQQIEYSGWTEKHRYWVDHLPTMIQGYESVAGQPAWREMRNMDLHPTKAVLPNGTIMSGNVLRRNIISWRDPKAKPFSFRSVSLDHNQSDYNLFWHGGQPIATGQFKIEKTVGPDLLTEAGFADGQPDKLPSKWRWQAHPKDATAGRPAEAGDEAVLELKSGAAKDDKGNFQAPVVVSLPVDAKPGQAYRLSAQLRADRAGVKAAIAGQSHIAKVYFWAKTQAVEVGPQWQPCEVVFRLPAPGEPGHHAEMKTLAARFDLQTENARLWIKQPALHAAEIMDEWKAWQSQGQDVHSLVADPRFVAADKDDYRLLPDSPALKLGFQPIPVEKIGPYADPLRASWPIVEAEGAREKPLISD